MQYADLISDEVLYSGRKEDIQLGDETVFSPQKHQEYMRRNIAFAERCIQKRLRDLGVSTNIGFDKNRIFFGNHGQLCPLYMPNHDIILIPKDSSLSLNTLIHEMLHAYSSEWQGREPEVVESRRHKKKGIVSSGFSSHIGENRMFNSFNEGVTDLMMSDILQENTADLEELNAMNAETRNKYVLHLRGIYGDEIAKVLIEAEEQAQEREKELQERKDQLHRENVEEFKERSRSAYREYKKMGDKEDYDSERDFNRILYESGERTIGFGDDFQRDMDEHLKDARVKITEVTRDYRLGLVQETTHSPTYKKEAEMVYVFIDMIAYARTGGDDSVFAPHQQAVWAELQKLYITGNLIGLRRLCNEVSEGKLLFDTISRLDTSGDEDSLGVEEITERLVDYIRTHFIPNYIKRTVE